MTILSNTLEPVKFVLHYFTGFIIVPVLVCLYSQTEICAEQQKGRQRCSAGQYNALHCSVAHYSVVQCSEN